MPFILILCTCGSVEEGAKITQALLKKRLAACVNMLPVRSRYLWKGKIESSDEQLLLVKTVSSSFEAVRECIASIHSYEVPEIIAVKIQRGSKSYLEWISGEVKARL